MNIPGLAGPSFRLAGPLLLLFLTAPSDPVSAQLRGPSVGVVEAAELLRQLDGEKRVLMIGAHPDDEDTSMLAALARGHGVRTAYLSLTRGEGGQNLIGPDLEEALGLIRTGELVSARSVDGAEQYFSRAIDFGYSKTLEEALGHWPEEELVGDVVWVVRLFRPHVILSVFTGTPSDGHGQHQAAGVAARLAFEAAADPSRFVDQLALGVEAWATPKLYQLRRGGGQVADVLVETGQLDPLLGRSFHQVAMESRSRHRSQAQGASQAPGPRASGGTLVESRVSGSGVEDGFFVGIDTTLVGIARAAGGPAEAVLLELIRAYREALLAAAETLQVADPEPAVAHLVTALSHLEDARAVAAEAPAGLGRTELVNVLERRGATLARAIAAAGGIVVDARADRARVSPGETIGVDVVVWNGGAREIVVTAVDLALPSGWTSSGPVSAPYAVPPGELETIEITVEVPESAEPSRPYFLTSERDGDLYRWPADPEVMGRPRTPPPIVARVEIARDGSVPVEIERAASYVGVERASGEYRVPLHVLPRMAVQVERRSMAWPAGEAGARSVSVRVSNLSAAGTEGELRLIPRAGWTVSPELHPVELPEPGGEATFAFQIRPTPGAAPGVAGFRAVVTDGGGELDESVVMVDYPHIEPAPLIEPAELWVSYFPVRVAEGLRVGYVQGPGAGDLTGLADLGVDVEALVPEDLRSGSLDRFTTILVGIRAYETRDDLLASNQRLLDFARDGGTVVVQYNQYAFANGDFAPYPVEMARPHDRVTDPDAEVTFLDPGHRALTAPNPLSASDFEGWVQERGLYFLNRWDDRYTPLLRMADPGEEPNSGSLVVARVGEGAYVYTGLALFRQLPRGLPGAFRILANLISLRGSEL